MKGASGLAGSKFWAGTRKRPSSADARPHCDFDFDYALL